MVFLFFDSAADEATRLRGLGVRVRVKRCWLGLAWRVERRRRWSGGCVDE